jgi:hypothetical protein
MTARKKTSKKKPSRVRSALSSIYKRMASVGQSGMARVRKLRNRTGPDHLAADEEDFAYIEKEAHDILGAIARLRSRDMGEYPLPEHFGMEPDVVFMEEGPRDADAGVYIHPDSPYAQMLRAEQEQPARERLFDTQDGPMTAEEILAQPLRDKEGNEYNMTRGRRRNRAGLPTRPTRSLGVPLRAKDAVKKVRLTTTDKQIIQAMARALFVSAWASKQEEKGRSFSGRDIMDEAPRTNVAAKKAAMDLADRISLMNGSRTLQQLFMDAVSVGGSNDPFAFGHYLAMQSLGSGVSWFDDNPEFPLNLPLIEFYY